MGKKGVRVRGDGEKNWGTGVSGEREELVDRGGTRKAGKPTQKVKNCCIEHSAGAGGSESKSRREEVRRANPGGGRGGNVGTRGVGEQWMWDAGGKHGGSEGEELWLRGGGGGR